MLRYLFNKFADLILCNFFEKKNSGTGVLPVSFPKFLRRPILWNMPVRILEWNEPKYCLHKIYSQENSWSPFWCSCRYVDLQFFQKVTASLILFYENWQVLQNINFTDQCWATASDFLWYFQCITYLINDKSVQS